MSADKVKILSDQLLTSLKVQTVSSARIGKNSVQSIWSQASVNTGKKSLIGKVFPLPQDPTKIVPSRHPLASFNVSGDTVLQTYEKKTDSHVDIINTKTDKGEDVSLLRIVQDEVICEEVNLTDLDLHGPVYNDTELGSLAVSDGCWKVAYIAEDKPPKNQPFFKEAKPGSRSTQGQEFAFRQDFGEQMIGKISPRIVLLDLKAIPSDLRLVDTSSLPAGYLPGQVTFSDDNTLIGMAVNTKPRKLGLVYCTNRPSILFKLDLTTNELKVIAGGDKQHVRCPRVSPDGKTLVFLQRELGVPKNPGPHQTCMKLMKLDLDTSSPPSVLIDSVPVPDENNAGFTGIYRVPDAPDDLPANGFTDDGKYFVLNTIIFDTIHPIVCDVISGKFNLLKEAANTVILDVRGDSVLGVKSSVKSAPKLVMGQIQDGQITFQDLSVPQDLAEEISYDSMTIKPSDGGVDFSATFVYSGEGQRPLIFFPHGGPHSVTSSSYNQAIYFFILSGYNVLYVNYRGSIGAGSKSIESILGKIGRQDVDDCMLALDTCLNKHEQRVSKDAVTAFGGSHGGFLSTHLVGQFPERFQAAVVRNPVTNIATMSSITDISDWTFNEAGLDFDFKSPTPEIMTKMYEASPIAHVDNVQAPVLLAIGKNDVRVPPSQGYEYYNNLKTLGKEVEMMVYDDNHPLAKVSVNANFLINTILFFDKALQL